MTQNSNNCQQPSPNPPRPIIDPSINNCETPAQFIGCEGVENKFNADSSPFQGLDADTLYQNKKLGSALNCNPMLTGTLVEGPDDPELPPDRSVIYRYAKGLRAIDDAVKSLFYNMKVLDENGKVFTVPIIWGSQEKAVTMILQSNVRKDNSGVVDRITLPMLSIYRSSFDQARERYVHEMAINYMRGVQRYDNHGNKVGAIGGSPGLVHREKRNNDTILGTTMGAPVDLGYVLTIWTAYWEDMNQIVESIRLKFNPFAYIRLQGITSWESTVRIDSVNDNLDLEPGENKRVFKCQINLTAESYIPQPIVRRKSVLKTRVEIADSINEQDIKSIVSRIEKAVGDLE